MKARCPKSPEQVVLSFGPDEDDPEMIERRIFLPVSFPIMELRAIGEILEAEEVFVPGYLPPQVGICHPDAFIFEAQLEGIQTVLLPDRNIASRMAQIAAGIPLDATLRKVAAIKAFCHFLDIEIEPSIAFHELAQTQGNEAANAELARFRAADDADPAPWLDLAFGELDALSPLVIQKLEEPYDLAFPLRRWRRNYIAALKIAELELTIRPNIDRMLKLLTWMRDDFVIAGPAALLGCIYFAPKSPPRKRLFKQLRSPDRHRAIEGVRNAAWDLTHLSDLVKRVNEGNNGPIRLLFASFDAGLRNLARLLIGITPELSIAKSLGAALLPYWGEKDAERIAKLFTELFADIDASGRKQRQAKSPVSIDEMILRGEKMLMSVSGVS